MPANAKFIKWIHLPHINEYFRLMAAGDYSITEYSTLDVDSASFFPTKCEILDIEFNTRDLDPEVCIDSNSALFIPLAIVELPACRGQRG